MKNSVFFVGFMMCFIGIFWTLYAYLNQSITECPFNFVFNQYFCMTVPNPSPFANLAYPVIMILFGITTMTLASMIKDEGDI